MTVTITPPDAFALAYLPAVCGFLPIDLDIIEAAGRDPHDEKLAHALSFAAKAVKLAADSPKSSGPRRLTEVAARTGLTLSAMPSGASAVAAFTSSVRSSAQAMLSEPVQRAAFAVGVAAGDLHSGLRVGANVIYLRCAAPENPLLQQRAVDSANIVRDASQRLLAALRGPGVPATLAPLLAKLTGQLAKPPDLVAATDSAAYAKYNDWVAPIWDLLNDLGKAFAA